MLVLLTPHRS